MVQFRTKRRREADFVRIPSLYGGAGPRDVRMTTRYSDNWEEGFGATISADGVVPPNLGDVVDAGGGGDARPPRSA